MAFVIHFTTEGPANLQSKLEEGWGGGRFISTVTQFWFILAMLVHGEMATDESAQALSWKNIFTLSNPGVNSFNL